MMAMLLFLELNGVVKDYTDSEIIRVCQSLAVGSMDAKKLLDWLLN